MQSILLRFSLVPLLISIASTSHARLDQRVADVLALSEPPVGVVFEIISGDSDFLDEAIPAIREQSARLRARFKDLPIAVVTHGNEQFALLAERAEAHPGLHKDIKTLQVENSIPVHVCGTYAGWRGLSEEDFPGYVDVAPSGPAQIRNYVELGYVLIEVDLD